MNGCFSGGGFIGAIFGGWACDYLGRKKTLVFALPIAIVGGAFQGGAVHIAMFLVGRFLSGFAVGEYPSSLFSIHLCRLCARCPCGFGSIVPIRSLPACHQGVPRRSTW